MIRTKFAPMLALALVAVTTWTADAKAQIDNMQLSETKGGPSRSAFSVGTEVVYVGFDYLETDNSTIAVVLEGLGMYDILYQSDRYSGTGHADVPITGSDVFESLTIKLSDSADAAQASAKIARDASVGLREYLQQVEQQVNAMNTILDVFDAIPLDAERKSQVVDMRVQVSELARLAEEANQLNFDEQSALQAKAREMKAPADAAVQVAEALAAEAGETGPLPLPPTGSGQGDYTVQLLLGFGTSSGSPAADLSFTITEMSDAPTDLKVPGGDATATAAAAKGNVGANTPTRASNAAGAGAGAGGNATAPPGATAAPSGSGSSGSASAGGSGTAGRAGTTAGAPSGATSPVTGREAVGSGTPAVVTDAEGSSVESADEAAAAGGVDREWASGSGDEASAGEAMPTWTVPAGGQLALGDSGQPSADMQRAGGTGGDGGSAGASGRNLALLAIGVVALSGVAVWLRGRM